MRIRKANHGDAAAIAKISVDTWRATYKGIVSQAFLDQMSYQERTNKWKQKLIDPKMFSYIAETEKGEAVGYANGGGLRGEGAEKLAELYAIYILPNYQRSGLGKQLLKPVVQTCVDHSFEQMVVWVLEGNKAVLFYKALGAEKYDQDTIELAGETLNLFGYRFKDLKALLDS
ncbi:GNAT family N-acetyltransferase [Halobacillus shinanisalinarum]|uniref:GNAT family N-acetyltransferase n=1 Tax=Halobacillus shinanisalinarum TaxID=2932258 RepID=A0ABY4GX09_9BACI|nr:GNAT family N-acetyltransferase [Halobacillus shinanisalinarum]UOQ92712.1 GNAT family N-acetyltransferase [Halobacillus shinanisalinarum]